MISNLPINTVATELGLFFDFMFYKYVSPTGFTPVVSAAPAGLDGLAGFYPQLKLRAILGCPFGTEPAGESAEGYLIYETISFKVSASISKWDNRPQLRQANALMP
jgi:hypothetical protein